MNTKSYMSVVPKNPKDLEGLETILNNLESIDGIKILKESFEDDILELSISVDDVMYDVDLVPVNFQLPTLYRIQHIFNDIDIENLKKAEVALLVSMHFNENPLKSYHAQLKIINALLPNSLVIIDESSEKMLSSKWVNMCAASKIPPSPSYLYTVHAVSDDDGDIVWLHTHGLNRCGLTELEVLNSNKNSYHSHFNVIEIMATRLLDMSDVLTAKEPLYLAEVATDVHLVTTFLDWEEAIKLYPEDTLGGANDRKDYHNENTSVIYAYLSPDDCEQGNLAHIDAFDEFLQDNPIYMLSNEETMRMTKLAKERLAYMLKKANEPETQILLKIALDVDEEHKEICHKENIWFELLEVKGNEVVCKLTQEPYYVKDMQEGSVGTYSFDEITDWLIYTDKYNVTPDTVYLLEL